MEDRRQEVLERKDAEHQMMMEQQIGEYQHVATATQIEESSRREVEHQKNLKKVDDEAEKALEELGAMTLSEEGEHEEKLAAEQKKGKEAQERAAQRMDAVTRDTVESLKAKVQETDDLKLKIEVQTNQAKEKNKEKEVMMSAAVFDEAQARQAENQAKTEDRQKELLQKEAEIKEEELKGVKAERELNNENCNKLVALRQEDAKITKSLAEMNLALLKSDCDSKNRGSINEKITTIKKHAEELKTQYEKAHGKLSLAPEKFAKLNAMHMKAIQKALTRFSEYLMKVSGDLGLTEELLAKLEFQDVDKAEEIRAIKTKVSAFSEVISYLKTMVEINDRDIDNQRVKELEQLKNELFEMINKMELVSEKRADIIERIDMLQESTSNIKESSERLRIEN